MSRAPSSHVHEQARVHLPRLARFVPEPALARVAAVAQSVPFERLAPRARPARRGARAGSSARRNALSRRMKSLHSSRPSLARGVGGPPAGATYARDGGVDAPRVVARARHRARRCAAAAARHREKVRFIAAPLGTATAQRRGGMATRVVAPGGARVYARRARGALVRARPRRRATRGGRRCVSAERERESRGVRAARRAAATRSLICGEGDFSFALAFADGGERDRARRRDVARGERGSRRGVARRRQRGRARVERANCASRTRRRRDDALDDVRERNVRSRVV